jgi:hypothetical protein
MPYRNNGETAWTSLAFPERNTGWVVGSDFYGNDESPITFTVNRGFTWHAQESGTFEPLRDVFFTDTGHGWIVGYFGTILKYSE